MSSWFSAAGLDGALSSLTESVSQVTESVKEAIPEEYKEGLAKLTLNTEEMINERQTFREEAQRKAEAKKRLDSILPWETRDAERDILVEECKEAILQLSQEEETFYGPYEMPLLNVQLENEEEENEDGEDAESKEEDEAEAAAAVPVEKEKPPHKHRHMKPTEESKEKLAKLQPLPPLLEEFDLDSHVGLIQKVLKEDPVLVKMQASLSGGGARERIFWKNYFFHCAFTRYEAGLSIDEIWSYQVQEAAETSATDADTGEDAETTTEEETVTCGADADEADGSSGEPAHAGFQDVEKVMAADEAAVAEFGNNIDGSQAQSEGSPNSGFEFVDDGMDAVAAGDPELDELEAEIARELEG